MPDQKHLAVTFRLAALYKMDDDTGNYVAFCPALDLYSQGSTSGEAAAALRSAVTMFLKECYRRKLLDDFLVDAGFGLPRGEQHGDAAPEGEADEFIALHEYTHQEVFEVPLHLIMQAERGPEWRLS